MPAREEHSAREATLEVVESEDREPHFRDTRDTEERDVRLEDLSAGMERAGRLEHLDPPRERTGAKQLRLARLVAVAIQPVLWAEQAAPHQFSSSARNQVRQSARRSE